jgi:integrase
LEAILTAPSQPRDRAFLMTVYACGLRVAEARDLKTSDIDRARMQLRVRNGKGGKGRVLPLSNRLLKELVDYWQAQRQGKRATIVRGSSWATKPSRSVQLPARTSITAQSKRAVCAAKAAFIHYATIPSSGRKAYRKDLPFVWQNEPIQTFAHDGSAAILNGLALPIDGGFLATWCASRAKNHA